MFACLYSLSAPIATLVRLAEEFTPRFEVVGPLVMLDIGGLARLLGTPQEIGEQLRRSSSGPVRIAVAPTQTAAVLLAMGRAGLTVVLPGDHAAALAPLPVSVLADFDRQRLTGKLAASAAPIAPTAYPAHAIAPFEDTLPYFQQSVMNRASDAAVEAHCSVAAVPALTAALDASPTAALEAPTSGGWMHPRDSHAANLTRRTRRPVTAPRDMEHAHAAIRAHHIAAPAAPAAPDAPAAPVHRTGAPVHRTAPIAPGAASAPVAPATKAALSDIQSVHATLRRWGVKTFGAFAALSPGEVYERLGARGVLWQRLARGEDTSPLVPWIPEDPFEAALELEWPIEGLEPLSFVLGRLFDPLADRLERADRGAAIVHTHLRLVNKETHARMLQLPAPMRDAKTLRTLVLLDLESNPPSAGVDRVRVLVEPTPARVVQWALFARASASPEQVSTLLARLTALMGDGHVGSPRLVDTWKPGAFELTSFAVHSASHTLPARPPERTGHVARADSHGPVSVLRRFRLPVPARVQVQDGRPVRVMTDRRGVSGGLVAQAAGPWRTSGEWWNDDHPGRAWDRDEWEIALHDGVIYRVYVERGAGQWFIEGVVD